MTRVLYLARAFYPVIGGAENLALQRCRAFSPPEDLIVLAPDGPRAKDTDTSHAFRVIRWPYSPSWAMPWRVFSLAVLPILWALALTVRYGIRTIECSQALPNGIAALTVKRLFGTRITVWALGNDVFGPKRSRWQRALLKVVFMKADRIIAISQYTLQGVTQLFTNDRTIRNKTIIIHPPIDLERFKPGIDGSAIREQHQLNGKLVLLTVARVVRRKGIDVMLRALPEILARVPNAVYVVIGTGSLLCQYQELARELDIQQHVIFAGKVTDNELPEYYSAADIVILCSQSDPELGDVEGFGIVLREAGACGRAVIGSSEGGIPDAVGHEENGLLVDPRDIDAIVSAVIRLSGDMVLRQTLGNQGVLKAQVAPDWDAIKHG